MLRIYAPDECYGPLADIVRYYSNIELDNPIIGQLPDDGLAPVEELPIVRGYSYYTYRFHTISPKVAEQHYGPPDIYRKEDAYRKVLSIS